MEKFIALMALIASLGLAACQINSVNPDENTPEIVEEQSPADDNNTPEVIEKPSPDNGNNTPAASKEGNSMKNDFELLKYMKDDVNYMVSPFSLRMAMMLAANGAEGKTKEEILQGLNVSNIDEYNKLAKELIEKYKSNENVKLNVANSIWLNKTIAGSNIHFAKEYASLIKEFYEGEAQIENDDEIAKKANQWIEAKTNGKIKNVLDEKQKADFLALLINTIYFKGAWADQFEKYATRKDTFTDRKGIESQIDFMHKTRKYDYFEDETMKMVKLPYEGNDTAMYIVLPTDEEKMDIASAMEKMEYCKVNLAIPKFKTEYSLSFKDVLEQLGIEEAFSTSDAKFKNIMFGGVNATSNVYIGDVLQKTFIEVDEEGTEAAAATAVIMNVTSAMPQPEIIKEFKADRPFIYFITDENTKQVLFMGEYAFAK